VELKDGKKSMTRTARWSGRGHDEEDEDGEHGSGEGMSQRMPQPMPALAGGVGLPGTRWAYRAGPPANGWAEHRDAYLTVPAFG
jgi:hypothetical protein